MIVVSVILFLAVSVHGGILLGSKTAVEVTEDVRNAANFATDTINAKQNNSNWFTLNGIKNPTIRLVNGVLYGMEIELKESECPNNKTNTGASITYCPAIHNGATTKCKVEVWLQLLRIPEYILGEKICHKI
ncbi:hypothetical protein SNE40_015384 [Patella caerulea]|uniref:Cystatin domain-containing protein n=1 Tax=Patella caerulea TaxID=87958 RepID=A0AAN8JKI1_PATCE